MKLIAAVALCSVFASPACAYDVFSGCASPAAPVHTWTIDPAYGSTPDEAHGGRAFNGVMGTADGSAAHPFNSLAAVFKGGAQTPVDGYSYPLLSSIGWDHYGVNVGFGRGVGANGQRKDTDWAPAKPGFTPNPNRINPGDRIVLRSGAYGDVATGYYGVQTANVDASGSTAFIEIVADRTSEPTFLTLNANGSRGFAFNGVKIKSMRSQGAPNSNGSLVYISGNAMTPTKDIIVANSWIGSFENQKEADSAYATYQSITADNPPKAEQPWLKSAARAGVTITGDTLDGANSNCLAIEDSTIQWTTIAAVASQKVHSLLVKNNDVNHFFYDAFDLYAESHVHHIGNHASDPIDLGDGGHPDTFQYGQLTALEPGPFVDIVIDGNSELERTDPLNPWPQHVTGYQHTNAALLDGAVITNNRFEVSNCPGIAIGPDVNATVANNTVIGNGITPGPGCPNPRMGEVNAVSSKNNHFVNNVIAGGMYQLCGVGSVWEHNVMIASRSGGQPTMGRLGYCNKDGKMIVTATPGTYNGVTVDATNAVDFAFKHYDPPASGLTPPERDLHPASGGLLDGKGTAGDGIPTVNIDGEARGAPPHVGAY